MKLRYQKRALNEIDRALGHIEARSPQGSAKVEARLAAILLLIQQRPYIGARTRIHGVRRLVLTPFPYLLYYYVGDDEIVIQRFRQAARRPIA